MNKAKKQRKTLEWERLEVFSKNLEITQGNISGKNGHDKEQNGKDLTEAEDIKKRWQECKNYPNKVVMTWITTMVWSLNQSQTSWGVKSSGPLEALLQTKLVEVMDFQLSCMKS